MGAIRSMYHEVFSAIRVELATLGGFTPRCTVRAEPWERSGMLVERLLRVRAWVPAAANATVRDLADFILDSGRGGALLVA